MFSLLLCLSTAHAVPPDVQAAWTSIAQVQSLEAHFRSEQHRAILSKPQQAEGTLRFTRPDKLSWQWHSPMRSLFVMDGSQVGMFYPDLEVRESIDLAKSPEMMGMVRGMMVWLTGDLAEVERDFVAEWRVDGARLTPRKAELKRLFDHLELTVGGSPLGLTDFTLVEPDGDKLVVHLSAIKHNITFSEDTFRLPAAP